MSQQEYGSEQGSVTVEYAVLLPLVVLFLALILGTAGLGIERIKVEESARVGARLAARGESAEQVSAAVQQIAGTGTSISEGSTGDLVSLTVTTSSSIPILGWVFPDHTVTAFVPAEMVGLP